MKMKKGCFCLLAETPFLYALYAASRGRMSSHIRFMKRGYIWRTTSSQPQPQPPRNKTGVVTASSLRLRRSASTNSAIITSLPNGTVVTILGQTTGTDRQKWYHISVKRNGRTLKGFTVKEMRLQAAPDLSFVAQITVTLVPAFNTAVTV